MTSMTGKDIQARLRESHYLGDDAKARLPEPAADLIHLLRQERKEAADALDAQAATIARLERELGEATERAETAGIALDSMHQNRDTLQRHFNECTVRAEKAEKALGEAREALSEIDSWSRAYPLAIFPEPDFVKVRQLLVAGGITLDAVSASNMRHVVEGVGVIARRTLGASS